MITTKHRILTSLGLLVISLGLALPLTQALVNRPGLHGYLVSVSYGLPISVETTFGTRVFLTLLIWIVLQIAFGLYKHNYSKKTLLILTSAFFIVLLLFLRWAEQNNSSRLYWQDRCLHYACPICLSSGTQIDADKGWRQVTSLKVGDLVWSINNKGQRVLVPIVKTTKRVVPQGTQLLHVTLQDGRSLLVSPNHPTASGQLFKDIKVGDSLDYSNVVSISRTIYIDGFTYDILPRSSSGDYWANGVLVGSTLKQ